MKAVVYQSPSENVNALLSAMAEGISRSGITVERFRNTSLVQRGDFAVVWGWRIAKRSKEAGFSGPGGAYSAASATYSGSSFAVPAIAAAIAALFLALR